MAVDAIRRVSIESIDNVSFHVRAPPGSHLKKPRTLVACKLLKPWKVQRFVVCAAYTKYPSGFLNLGPILAVGRRSRMPGSIVDGKFILYKVRGINTYHSCENAGRFDRGTNSDSACCVWRPSHLNIRVKIKADLDEWNDCVMR